MKQAVVLAVILQLLSFVTTHRHGYNCVFDHINQDLSQISANAQPDIAIHQPGQYLNGRLLTAPNPSRAPIRIYLDTSDFNSSIQAGVNGAATTTTTNLNFVLRTMMVAQAFYQKRLQVSPVGTITAPSPCFDFTPTDAAQTVGYANTDLLIFVKYLSDKNLTYGATGKSCKYFPGTTPDYTLQTGRPTVGRIIFNTYQLVDQQTQLTNRLFQSITSTALHETMHILGFDSLLYPTYLNPSTGYTYSSAPMAATTVNANRPATKQMTTPFVVAWAKSFFGCSSLTGMPLQNQDSTGLGAGSHWQRVAMYDELMTGTSLGTAKYFSGLTFALLKDTGWYTVDDTFVQTSNYGYQKGCSFLTDACYSSTSFTQFCNAATQQNVSYCSSDFTGKAICSNESNLMADGCGIYGEYFSCIDSDSVDTGNYQPKSLEVWSSSSFCVASTMGKTALSSNLQSRCYPFVCNTNSITFTIGTYSVICLSSEAGQSKTLSGLSGYLTCPSYTSYCSVSRKTCSSFCNQNGYCMGGVCNCYTGYYGKDCSKTVCSSGQYFDPVSNNCLSSCPPSSGYYSNVFSSSCEACLSPCSQCATIPTNCLACLSSVNGVVQYLYNYGCVSSCPLSTYPTPSMSCAACDTTTAFCLSCSVAPANCTSCQPNYYLTQPVAQSVTTGCTTSCPINFLLIDVVYFICRNACLSYQIQVVSNSSCVLCTLGTFKAADGTCTANCGTGYYPDSTQRACRLCDSSCQNCDGGYPQNCTSCSTGFLLLKICMTICPRGFYQDTSLKQCTLCPSTLSCSACAYNSTSSTPYCTSCIYGYFFAASNYTCTTSCLSTQYKNTWNNSCSGCDSSCSTCNGPTSYSCTSCSGSFLLTNSTGGYCLPACPAQGYTQTSSTSCGQCDPSCSSCSGTAASKCGNCSSGYFLSNGYCRYVCPNGTYPNSNTWQCSACDSSCSYCFAGSNSSCTSCATGLYLYNFTCSHSCPTGMTPNQWNMCFQGWHFLTSLILLLNLLL